MYKLLHIYAEYKSMASHKKKKKKRKEKLPAVITFADYLIIFTFFHGTRQIVLY